jgi:hypothetical protein
VRARAAALTLACVALVAGCDRDDDESRVPPVHVTPPETAPRGEAPSAARAPRRELGDEVARIALRPPAGGRARGTASIRRRGGELVVVVEARGLPPSGDRVAYEVWLYDARSRVKSLGAQIADDRGRLQGAGPVERRDLGRYRYVDVSRERIDRDERHSGRSVLRGELPREAATLVA